METETVTITAYDEDGGLAGTRVITIRRDGARMRAVADYRTATEALLASTASVAVKAWVRALNELLRAMMSELRD